MARIKPGPRITFGLISACFFVSGAAGLIYQIVWSRYLALLLGHTSYAVVAVLVAFMGGLGLGNAWFGGRADRSPKPLALYGWLEIGIGIYALAFPSYYALCQNVFIYWARAAHPGPTGLLALKFGISLSTLLVPTVLMGATFPVLVRFVTRSVAELRNRVAALYSINSAGAVLGCLVADFWWIPSSGLELTVYGAAGLNLLIGIVALGVSLRAEAAPGPFIKKDANRLAQSPSPAASAPATVSDARPVSAEEQFSRAELRLAVIGIGLSGFVAMLYEVAWTRVLALALGSSTHAFALMLVTFITGIAVGAWIIYLWKGLRRTLVAFGWVELSLAGVLLISLFFYQDLPYGFVKLAGVLARREPAYPVYQFMQALLCFAVMFAPTVCLGMTLPLVSRIATVDLPQAGRSVGSVFAVNTFGTVLGTIATGLWLMPWLGLARTFAFGIALNALIGLAVLGAGSRARLRSSMLLSLLAVIAVVWSVSAKLDPVWRRAFSMGLWRAPNPPESLQAYKNTVAAMPLTFHKDGAGATVDVYSWSDEDNDHMTLKVNGKADAGTQADMITQLLLGHLPMLLHPESQRALVIGLGSGMTCGAVARHPTVQAIDAVEISPEVIQAAKLFAKFNDRVLENPKLHVILEDAKSFLQITDHKYDLIVSEPSNPWMAGVAAVFSKEYYETCAARLQPGGCVAQWMHVYETTDETVTLVLRTFSSVFPYMSIWQPATGDLILVGSVQPLRIDLGAMKDRFELPPIKSDLARVDLLSFSAILAREIVPQQNGIFTIPPDGPIHSDYLPTLEYFAQKGFFLNQVAEHWREFREDFSPRAATLLGRYLRETHLGDDDFKALARDFQKHRIPEARLFRSLLSSWQAGATHLPFPVQLWSIAAERTPIAEYRALRQAASEREFLDQSIAQPEPLRQYASDLMETYRNQRSIYYLPPTTNLETVLQRLLEVDSAHQRIYRLQLAEIAWDRGDDARCLEQGQRAFDPDPAVGGPINYAGDPLASRAVLYRMAETLSQRGQWQEAWSVCQKARAGGYLDNAESVFPLLEMIARKVQTYMAQAQSAANPP